MSDNEIINTARKTLQEICDDKEAGASARVSAARTLLELTGALKIAQHSQGLKPEAEMTIDELNARLAALEEPMAETAAAKKRKQFPKREAELGKHLEETERRIRT